MFPFSIASAGNSHSQRTLIFAVAFALLVHGGMTDESFVDVKRSDFPDDFVFGVATAAAQIEGSKSSEGKGPSIWDQYEWKFPWKVAKNRTSDVAIDSYKRYKEDALVLRDVGVDAYRFSIPWTRILPNGTLSGGINQKGIDHYNSLIDELIKIGVKPFVTLLHFDQPEALEKKYGGFLNRSIVEDFKNYAEICFKTFGDRVKHWITINEPFIVAKFGYAAGIAAPGRCSDRKVCAHGNSGTEPYIVIHNLLLAHATAARLYKDKYQAEQGGVIGMSNVAQYYEPYSNTLADRKAARRAMEFDLGWYMEPLVRGQYPSIMRKLVKDRLPVFTEEEKELIKGSFDFFGLNYYTARYCRNIPTIPKGAPLNLLTDPRVNFSVAKDGVLIGPKSEGSIFVYIYPKGLYKMLNFVKKHYGENIPIYIFENGVSQKRNDTIPINQVLNDRHRIEFIQKHLQQITKAINKSVNVKGYFYWSLFDDFEWGEGYETEFGLYYIDLNDNLKRIPRKSARWYHDFIKCDKK
ncbi:hypothetical protein V6N13_109286 [Hibiscus sabdariffa]